MKRLLSLLALVAMVGGMIAAPANAGGRKPQTITLIELPERFDVDEHALIQAHVSSGLPLRFEGTTPAVCEDDGSSDVWVDVLGAQPGICRVVISQAGNSEWAPVEKAVTVEVIKATGATLIDTAPHSADPLHPLDDQQVWFAPGESIDVVIEELNPDFDPGASPEITGNIRYRIDAEEPVTAALTRVTRGDRQYNVIAFTIDASSLTRGEHTITAEYLGSSKYRASHAFMHPISVDLVSTVTVGIHPDRATVGDEVIVTVDVGLRDQPTPTPTGSVSVTANDLDLGTYELVAGRAQFTTKKIPGTAAELEAQFKPTQGSGVTGGDGTLLVELDQAASSAAVVGPGGAFVGDDATFTLGVRGADGGPVPSGMFRLTRESMSGDPGVLVGEYELGPNGTLEVNLPGDLPAGDYIYFGDYEGDGSYLPSSAPVHPFRVLKHDQEITFEGPDDLTVGQERTLSARTDSGLPVSFVSETTGACRVTAVAGGWRVRGLGAGSCALTARQPGNDEYEAADDVTRFAAVRKRDQKITFPALPSLAVGQSVQLRATADSGLPVRYRSETPAKCAVQGSTLVARAAGQCEVVASQPGNEQWQAAGEKARATIVTKGRQSISFTLPATGGVGRSVPINAKASSNLPTALLSSTRNVCTVSGRTLVLRAPGLCRVTASQVGNSNWLPAQPVTRAMTVAAAKR